MAEAIMCISIGLPNFGKRYCDFFDFQDGGRLPCWILEMLKFYWLMLPRGPSCSTTSNFVKMGQSVAEVSQFFDLYPRDADQQNAEWRPRRVKRPNVIICWSIEHRRRWLASPVAVATLPIPATSGGVRPSDRLDYLFISSGGPPRIRADRRVFVGDKQYESAGRRRPVSSSRRRRTICNAEQSRITRRVVVEIELRLQPLHVLPSVTDSSRHPQSWYSGPHRLTILLLPYELFQTVEAWIKKLLKRVGLFRKYRKKRLKRFKTLKSLFRKEKPLKRVFSQR